MKKLIPDFNKALIFLGVFLFSIQLFATTQVILVGGSSNVFSPATVTIQEGDQIVFELVSGSHPVVADNGTDWSTFQLANPGDQSSPFTLSVGVHNYHCQFHGGVGTGMHGTITVTAATGTKSAKSSYGLTISPNPVVDEVNFNFDQKYSELTSIKIVDLIGNEVAAIDLENSASGYRLDFSHLKPGVYFCNLYTNKGIIETRKLFRTK